eukprot:scaffold5742_cov246-Skeletonema_marinoi.AAC.1
MRTSGTAVAEPLDAHALEDGRGKIVELRADFLGKAEPVSKRALTDANYLYRRRALCPVGPS